MPPSVKPVPSQFCKNPCGKSLPHKSPDRLQNGSRSMRAFLLPDHPARIAPKPVFPVVPANDRTKPGIEKLEVLLSPSTHSAQEPRRHYLRPCQASFASPCRSFGRRGHCGQGYSTPLRSTPNTSCSTGAADTARRAAQHDPRLTRCKNRACDQGTASSNIGS